MPSHRHTLTPSHSNLHRTGTSPCMPMHHSLTLRTIISLARNRYCHSLTPAHITPSLSHTSTLAHRYAHLDWRCHLIPLTPSLPHAITPSYRHTAGTALCIPAPTLSLPHTVTSSHRHSLTPSLPHTTTLAHLYALLRRYYHSFTLSLPHNVTPSHPHTSM